MKPILGKAVGKITVPDLHSRRFNNNRISAVTAYDYSFAKLIDESGIDMILVGDSLGMVVQGDPTTLGVDIEHMIYHTRCVAKAVKRAHIVADMPFLSYQPNHEQAVDNAGQLIRAGADSVKIEGGEEIADLVWYLNKVGIPVMGHIGLKPQSIRVMGTYRTHGKTKAEADEIFNDAQTLEDADAFALLLEGVAIELAKEITETVQIPTIGIGSGVHCTGQIQVMHDLLGLTPEFKPRHARPYATLHTTITSALKTYIEDVHEARFPGESESTHRNLVEVKPLAETVKKP